jgi:hypothetical protein
MILLMPSVEITSAIGMSNAVPCFLPQMLSSCICLVNISLCLALQLCENIGDGGSPLIMACTIGIIATVIFWKDTMDMITWQQDGVAAHLATFIAVMDSLSLSSLTHAAGARIFYRCSAFRRRHFAGGSPLLGAIRY